MHKQQQMKPSRRQSACWDTSHAHNSNIQVNSKQNKYYMYYYIICIIIYSCLYILELNEKAA